MLLLKEFASLKHSKERVRDTYIGSVNVRERDTYVLRLSVKDIPT